MYEDVKRIIRDAPERIPDLTVGEFAELYRVLPRGTPYPGPWRNIRTPYLVGIMDALSAKSPAQEIVFAKSAQVGATSVIENWFGYIIKCVPGPSMYVTGNDKLLGRWTAKRLQPMLMSCNLDSRLKAQFLSKGQRRTGDKMFAKEFPGGSLDLVTVNSAVNLRMDSFRNLALDECDSYPKDVGGEGDPKALAKARTKTFKGRKKILYTSTPTTYDESHIWPMYEAGDQCRYFVPCIHCGKYQYLDFDGMDGKGGMKWDTTRGKLSNNSIRYECAHCGKGIYQKDKFKTIQRGEWQPTVKNHNEHYKSFHISALYSLMENWFNIIQNRIDAEGDDEKMRAHMNLDLGLPYRETGERPDVQKLYELRGDYKSGTIPHCTLVTNGVLFLTGAIDVQTGSKHGKDNVARLELTICGHGYQYKTWDILYKVFKGDVKDAYAGAWQDLYDWAVEGGMKFYRSDDMEFSPSLILIDSSDGNVEHIVFDFCDRWENTFPCKGQKSLKKTEDEQRGTRDEQSPRDADKFRENKKAGRTYYVIHTTWYKKKIYNNLKIKRQEGIEQPAQFCDFPSDYPDKYFEMLRAEEWRPREGVFWKPNSRRNESLDLRVYNLCAQDIWLTMLLKRRRDQAVKAGMSKEQSMRFVTRHIIDEYMVRMKPRKVSGRHEKRPIS
jgi:phage terminase large subunit GpA-like protein